MSIGGGLRRLTPLEWGPDRGIALLVLVASVLLFPLRFYVSTIFVHTIPVVTGLASATYLLTKPSRNRYSRPREWGVSVGTGRLVRHAVPVGLAAMLFVGALTGGRTLPFFGLAALVGSLLFAQILFLGEETLRPEVVLAHIVGYGLVLRGVALLTTPGFVGIDAWTHLPQYAAAVQQSGQLEAIADVKYFGAPLYHLLVVGAAEAFGTTLRTALYATLGVVMPLSVLLVFFTGRLFLPVRWALFATATFSVADHVVRWGIHIIPTSMGLVLFLAVFYGIARLYTEEHRWGLYALVLLFAIGTVLTHQISTFILLLFLGVGVGAQLFGRLLHVRFIPWVPPEQEHRVNFVGLLVLVLPVALLSWSRAPASGVSFLETMLRVSERSFDGARFLDLASETPLDTSPIDTLLTTVPPWLQLLDSLGFLLLLLGTLIGTFTLLDRGRLTTLSLVWIGTAGTMLFFTHIPPMFGVYFHIPLRWYAFMYAPMAVLAAYGMWHLELHLGRRAFVAALVVFALLFPGAMLVDHKATHDDPVAEDHYQRYAFSNAELDAARTITTLHPPERRLRTDHPYYLLFRDWQRQRVGILELTDDGTVPHRYVVAREYQTDGAPKVEYEGARFKAQLPHDAVCRPDTTVVYTNGVVQYCRAPPEGHR